MRLYRNDDMTAAVQWAGTQDEANKAFGRGRWSLVDVPTDKPNLIAWLNADTFDRGATDTPEPIAPTPAAAIPEYVKSLELDDEFEALPLARQLHFAGLALENARSAIKA